MNQSSFFWSLPYALRRMLFKWQNQKEYIKLQALRTREPEKITAPTFKPFLDNKCIFVHIPKSAGVSVGHSLFGRHTGNHTSISEYQMAFTQSEFNGFYKFSFVRNPWDKLLSAFLFLKEGGRNKGDQKWALEHLKEFDDFNDFVLNWVTKENVNRGIHFKPQYLFLTNPGSLDLKIDFVGRYENLEEDFNIVKQRLGVKGSLIFENKTASKTENYKSFYTDETKEIVAQVYKEDIALFQYQF